MALVKDARARSSSASATPIRSRVRSRTCPRSSAATSCSSAALARRRAATRSTTVVRDQQADKASVRAAAVRVFPEAPGIDVSTVAVVQADGQGRRPGRRRRGSVPGRARCASRRACRRRSRRPPTAKISAFVVLYPDKAITDPPSLTIEFAQGSTHRRPSSPGAGPARRARPHHAAWPRSRSTASPRAPTSCGPSRGRAPRRTRPGPRSPSCSRLDR